MPYLYKTNISMGRWRSGSGEGDDFLSGIWVDPSIDTEFTVGVPTEVDVWSSVDTLALGDIVSVIYRNGHWEVLSSNSAGSSDYMICCTTGVPVTGVYPVNLYGNGKTEATTGTGQVEVLNLNISESLPTGTWLVAHTMAITVTG